MPRGPESNASVPAAAEAKQTTRSLGEDSLTISLTSSESVTTTVDSSDVTTSEGISTPLTSKSDARELRKSAKTELRVLHCDIIQKDFWNAFPYLLENEQKFT